MVCCRLLCRGDRHLRKGPLSSHRGWAAFSFHRARSALDLGVDQIPHGFRRHFWRGRPVVVWLPLDGLGFSISLDQRYACPPTDLPRPVGLCRRPLGGLRQIGGGGLDDGLVWSGEPGAAAGRRPYQVRWRCGLALAVGSSRLRRASAAHRPARTRRRATMERCAPAVSRAARRPLHEVDVGIVRQKIYLPGVGAHHAPD